MGSLSCSTSPEPFGKMRETAKPLAASDRRPGVLDLALHLQHRLREARELADAEQRGAVNNLDERPAGIL